MVMQGGGLTARSTQRHSKAALAVHLVIDVHRVVLELLLLAEEIVLLLQQFVIPAL